MTPTRRPVRRLRLPPPMTRTRRPLPLLAFFIVAWSGATLAQTPLFPGIDLPEATQKPSAPAGDGLSPDLFYKLLLGDVALQRGESAQAARAYLDAARESQDPRIARRATEIALASRQRALAQEAAKLWASLDPAADRPKQV